MESDEAREKIRKLLVTGDNRLKQGVDPRKVRESFEQALALDANVLVGTGLRCPASTRRN